MLISFKHKFIFIHNYKVAGTSVKNALSDYGLMNPIITNARANRLIESSFFRKGYTNKYFRRLFRKLNLPGTCDFKSHLHSTKIEKLLPVEVYNDFFKFGFVRNPWDWQVSLYHYMSQVKGHHQGEIAKMFTSFEAYLDWRITSDKHSQKDFFYDKNNNKKVNFIGKIENMENDFNTICSMIGIDATLGHKNSSKRKNDYRKYYNSQTKNLLADHFEDDIKLFNYEF